jgi:uncharacterized membrane protein
MENDRVISRRLYLQQFPRQRVRGIHRHDVSGFGKVCWVILLIVLPYIGIFVYLLTQGRGMAQRQQEQAKQAQEELRNYVGFSAADEIDKLNRLKTAGSISEEEYGRLRARLVQ